MGLKSGMTITLRDGWIRIRGGVGIRVENEVRARLAMGLGLTSEMRDNFEVNKASRLWFG